MNTWVGFSSPALTAGVWKGGTGVPSKAVNSFAHRTDGFMKRLSLMQPPSSNNSPSSSTGLNMDKMSQNSCPHCPYVAACRANLLVHMRSHTGERPYACGLCDASFTISSNLKRHQRARHHDHWLQTREQDGVVALQGRDVTGGDAGLEGREPEQQGL